MIRHEKAIRGGPTYPDHHHIHIDRPEPLNIEAWRSWLETEAEAAGGKIVVHLGLDSMSDFLVVETP
jgi:hypothetical protein